MPAIFIDQYAPAGYPNIGTDPYGNYRLGQDTGQLSARSTKCTARMTSSSGLTAGSTRLTTSKPMLPSGSSASTPTLPMPARAGSDACGGDSMASFMMGQMTQGCASNGCGSNEEIQFRPATTNYQFGFFAQDDWKVTTKLTLNLGLRYDVTLAAHRPLQPPGLV